MAILLIPNYSFKLSNGKIYARNTEVAIFNELVSLDQKVNILGNISKHPNDLLNSKIIEDDNLNFITASNLDNGRLGYLYFIFNFFLFSRKSNLIYLFLPYSYAMLVFPFLLFNRNYACYIRGEINLRKGIYGFVYRYIIKNACFNICTGHYLTKKILELNPASVEVVPMFGFNILDNSLPDTRNDETLTFVYATGINYNKGIYELLDIVDEIIEEFPLVNFIIAGSGPKREMELFQKKYSKIRNRKKVLYLGRLENGNDIKELFSKGHVYLSLSHSEGFPRTVLEAMALGMVVISSDIDAVKGFLLDDLNALLYKRGNKYDLLRCIKILLSDPSIIKRLMKESIVSIDNKREYYKKNLSHAHQILYMRSNFLK